MIGRNDDQTIDAPAVTFGRTEHERVTVRPEDLAAAGSYDNVLVKELNLPFQVAYQQEHVQVGRAERVMHVKSDSVARRAEVTAAIVAPDRVALVRISLQHNPGLLGIVAVQQFHGQRLLGQGESALAIHP